MAPWCYGTTNIERHTRDAEIEAIKRVVSDTSTFTTERARRRVRRPVPARRDLDYGEAEGASSAGEISGTHQVLPVR